MLPLLPASHRLGTESLEGGGLKEPESPGGSALPCACPAEVGTRSLRCTAGRARGRPTGTFAEEIYQRNLDVRAAQFPGLGSSSPTIAQQRRLEEEFVSYYMTPLYPCFGEERLGAWGEGGKWICDAHKLSSASIVYSVGSQGETSFEEGLHKSFGVVTHTFDPTLAKEQVVRLNGVPFLAFHDLGWTGAADVETVAVELPEAQSKPFLRAAEVVERLGHGRVDVLKMDCEGCETWVIDDLLTTFGKYSAASRDFRVLFGQVLVEFHNLADPTTMVKQLQQMEDLGYRLFHAELNYLCTVCIELAYIHESIVKPP